MKTLNLLLAKSLIGAWSLVAVTALAGTAEVLSGQGQTMKLEYSSDMLRMDVGQGQGSYILLRDNRVYMVSSAAGQSMVVDATSSMGMLAGVAGNAAPSAAAGKVVSLLPTGRMEQHAGLTGEVYILKFVDFEGREHASELVLSDDPRAKSFSQAMSRMAVSMASAAGQQYSAAANDVQAKLLEINKGVLRYGKDMAVTALSDSAIPAARFVLPAVPLDLSAIRGLLGQ